MQVQIKEFTGPLDLLLQLIRREEMDILDIDIHKITHQYLTFIETQTLPDLDSAGDFIKMAATLIYIKSKSLLPNDVSTNLCEEEEEDMQTDPKQELVKNLLRVQKLQKIAKHLYQHPLLGRDVWSRQSILSLSNNLKNKKSNSKNDSLGIPTVLKMPTINLNSQSSDSQSSDSQSSDNLSPNTPFSTLNLLKVYQKTQISKQSSIVSITQPIPSVSDSIRAIRSLLTAGSQWKMSQLIDGTERKNVFSQTLVVFLSLLELSRLGIVSLRQDSHFSDIIISVIKDIREWKWETSQIPKTIL